MFYVVFRRLYVVGVAFGDGRLRNWGVPRIVVFRLLGNLLAEVRGQQGGGLQLFLHQLRVDLALLFRAELAPRHRGGTVGKLLGRRESDIGAEHLMHFAAHDLHHIGGAVDCFLGHGLGERVFAQRLVEFNPQSAFDPVQQHAGHFLAVHVATDILRQAGNDRVPLLVGSTIVRCRRLGRGLSHGLGGSGSFGIG